MFRALQSHITRDPHQNTRRTTEFEMQATLVLEENKFQYPYPSADLIKTNQPTIDLESSEE